MGKFIGHEDSIAADELSVYENQDDWGVLSGPMPQPKLTIEQQHAIEDAEWERASNARLNAKAYHSDRLIIERREVGDE